MNRLTWIASIALVAFIGPRLLAHRQPEALTTIAYNSNSESTEIVHRLHAHDAERILEDLADGETITIDSLEGRARLALYVEARFELAGQNGDPLPNVKLLGAELDGDTLYVYQEYAKTLPKPIRIRNGILRDFLPNQINTVNLYTEAGVRTLVFSKSDTWKMVPR